MDAFTRMMGQKASPIIPEAQLAPQPSNPQEAMMLKMLKMMMPGFDPQVIVKLGSDIQGAAEYFRASVDRIEAQNKEIISRLERMEHASSSHGGGSSS